MDVLGLLAVVVAGSFFQAGSGHENNSVFRDVLTAGMLVHDKSFRPLEPKFSDDQTPEDRLKTLRQIAGGPHEADEMLRESLTAPSILKLDDVPLDGVVIRKMDLYFVVHTRLEDLRLDDAETMAAKPVEVANMKVASTILSAGDVQARQLSLKPKTAEFHEWYTHMNSRLLDRVVIDSTDQVMVTRTPQSVIVATKTARGFDHDSKFPNAWSRIDREDRSRTVGNPTTYEGGCSYLKMTRIGPDSDSLLVEGHFLFAEPLGWFDGAAILRSKFSLIAQDQVRKLRREAISLKKSK